MPRAQSEEPETELPIAIELPEGISQDELQQLKPMIFPEEEIKAELIQPGVTQPMINAILAKRLVNLDTGDFTHGQLKSAQSYFVKEMTADINQIGANAGEDEGSAQRPQDEDE